jgi:hypothetical protein
MAPICGSFVVTHLHRMGILKPMSREGYAAQRKKTSRGMYLALKPTDIIAIVNYAWLGTEFCSFKY